MIAVDMTIGTDCKIKNGGKKKVPIAQVPGDDKKVYNVE